jgi:hypothetical protein
MLATRWCWTKRRDEPERSSAWPNDSDDAAAELEEDDEEPEQPDEDRARKMCTDVVVDKVDDVVDGEVVAEKSKTAGVGIMSRRGLAALREGTYAHRMPARTTQVKNSL